MRVSESLLAGSVPAGRVPAAIVQRLPRYWQHLDALAESGVDFVSSPELAEATGVSPAQLRKDLSYLGFGGIRGVGYEVATLREQLVRTFGADRPRPVVIVGSGRIGSALASYPRIGSANFDVVGIFDADPAQVGRALAGRTVEAVDDMVAAVRARGAELAILAVPAGAAQHEAERLVEAGITGVLCFAPINLRLPAHVAVRRVDLAHELQVLAFHAAAASAAAAQGD